MSFWEKLGLGLKKSSAKITTGISDIFTKKKLDAATLEELEELLLTADLGVQACSKIMQNFAEGIKSFKKTMNEDDKKTKKTSKSSPKTSLKKDTKKKKNTTTKKKK